MAPVARLQNGHSKSPYSTSVSGASGLPRMWSRSGSTGRISFSPTGSGGLTQSVIRKIAHPSEEGQHRRQQDADARLVLPCRFGDRDVDDEK